MKVLEISNPSGSFNQITLIVEGFAKYTAQNFAKNLDKFRIKRVGKVKIPPLSYGKSTL